MYTVHDCIIVEEFYPHQNTKTKSYLLKTEVYGQ